MSDEPDYVTINPAVAAFTYNVCVMRFARADEGYAVFRISQPLNRAAADALAQSWAAAMKLEIR